MCDVSAHRHVVPSKLRDLMYMQVFNKIGKYIPMDRKIKILDAGCGDGFLSEKIKNTYKNTNVLATDLDNNSLRDSMLLGLDTKMVDLQKKFPFADQSYDLILSNQVIEHLLDPDFFLKEVNRVIKKNGVVVLATPNLAAWFNRILLLLGIQPFYMETSTKDKTVGLSFTKKMTSMREPLGHIRIFTKDALKDLLEMYGFQVVEIRGLYAPYLPVFMRYIDKFFSNFSSLASNLFLVAYKK